MIYNKKMEELLNYDQIKERQSDLKGDWELTDDKVLKRTFEFYGFDDAIEFVNKIAKVASQEDHHPDIHIFYNKVIIELTTHSKGGLTDRDFVVAGEIDEL